jgi:hypothetical protein
MPIRPTSNAGVRTLANTQKESESTAQPSSKQDTKGSIRGVGDAFENKAGDPMVDRAVNRFAERTNRILGNDAMGMARRSAGLEALDRTPTEAQVGEIKEAAVDMLKEMPVRAFAPELAIGIEDQLRSRGLSVEGLQNKKLGDLGKVGSDVAKQIVDDFKDNHPRSFYGLAAGVAIGGAAYAYDKGSDALVKLGVKPEMSKKLGENSKVDLKAKWGERFTSYEASADANHTFKGDGKSTSVSAGTTVAGGGGNGLDMTSLRLGIAHDRKLGDASRLRVGNQAEFKGERLILNSSIGGSTNLDHGWKLSAGARLTSELSGDNFEAKNLNLNNTVSRSGFKLNNSVNLDSEGIKDARSSLAVKDQFGGNTSLRADFGRDLELTKLSAGYGLDRNYRGGRLYVDGRGAYDLRTDTFEADLSAGYRKGNLDFGVVAGRNERVGNYVGAGLKWSF